VAFVLSSFRSPCCRFVCSPHSPCPSDPFRNRTETFDSVEPPPNSEESKVSPAFLTQTKAQARSKGAVLRTHRSQCPTKRRNPTWGSPRIAQQITLAFGIAINKDMVRRILVSHYRPGSGDPPG
jgi:hypothetical protein